VVAAQKDCLVILSPAQQKIKHVSRTRSPVDIVSDKDGDWPNRWTPSAISIDALYPVQKVRAAVNISNSINSDAVRYRPRQQAALSGRAPHHVSPRPSRASRPAPGWGGRMLIDLMRTRNNRTARAPSISRDCLCRPAQTERGRWSGPSGIRTLDPCLL
jgi:hypothetical protein